MTNARADASVVVAIVGLLAACAPRESVPSSQPTVTAPAHTTPSPVEVSTSTPIPERPTGTYEGWIALVADLGSGHDLYVVNPTTLDMRSFGIAGLPPGFPAWSPDWTRIAFIGANDDVYVLEVACLDRGDCQESLTRFDRASRVYSTLSWLPDGEAVVFADIPDIDGRRSRLITLSLSGETTSVVLAEGVGSNPDVAPNGASVLFDSYLGLDQLVLFDISTRSIRPFMGETMELPNSSDGDWSPDGRRVAFETTFGAGFGWGRFDVMVAQADGSSPRVVAEDGMHPDWSPDGGSIVFEREDGLYVVNVATGVERKILDLPLIHSAPMPAWSP